MPMPKVSRRQVLTGAGAAVVAGAAGWFAHQGTEEEATVQGIQHSPPPSPLPSASPSPISSTQKISGTTRQPSITIPEGSRLEFDPAVNTTLEMTGNLIIEGELRMRPNAGVTHILRFVNVDESKFVGGGNDPIASDIGLWVIGAGRVDALGRRVGAGIIVRHDDGTRTSLGAGSRTVRIEGTPTGRAHVFIRSTKPAKQNINGVMFRYMGVSKPIPGDPEGRKTIVGGRYALHFHQGGDFSRGSVVANCLVRDAENRAYVPHASHGIRLSRNVAYRVKLDGFWWDPPDSDSEHATHDTLLEDNIVAYVANDLLKSTISGFTYAVGDRNISRRNVAMEVTLGGTDGWAHAWPRSGSGKWLMEDCVAHHCDQGIFTWSGIEQKVIRFRGYANNYRDIDAGAYRSPNLYESCVCESPLSITDAATSDTAGPLRFIRCKLSGVYEIPDVGVDGTVAVVKPVQVTECALEGGVVVNQPLVNGDNPTSHEFVNCTRQGRGLLRSDFTINARHARTKIVVRNANEPAFEVA